MSSKVYFVDDPMEYKVHKFKNKTQLLEFLNGTDFTGDPYDEVRVFEAVQIKPKLEN